MTGACALACGHLLVYPDVTHLGVLAMRRLITALVVAASSVAAEPSPDARTDRYGDPLPPGALLRLGTERLRLGTPIWSLEFSPDGTQLLTAGQDDGRIIIWDARTGK